MEELKVFAPSEVSLHTSKEDCWLIIGGKVYDVTKFLEEHPGGDGVLMEASANGDATEAFEEVGHSSTATSMMTSYLIGVLEGSELGARSESGQSFKIKEDPSPAPAKKSQERLPPPTSSSFSSLLVPLLVVGLAFAVWFVYYRG